jgi:ABC-type antimicrobial peptide transport system permease subunit
MSAVWARSRAELRTRWRAWLGLSLAVGVAAGTVLALAAGARRTASAYPRLVAVATVLIANLVAAVPAWMAARTHPATVLRSE